ncbi:MAG: cyclase family protein [Dehalococcoidia bacterium]|nr:cyclase family protein [Dehalococcoidia bacterium]
MTKSVILGSDFSGVVLKNCLQTTIEKMGWVVIEAGYAHVLQSNGTTLPLIAGYEVAIGSCQQGIVCCDNAQIAQIFFNKIKGVRAVIGHDEKDALLSRRNMDANLLILDITKTKSLRARIIARTWLSTNYDSTTYTSNLASIKRLEQDFCLKREKVYDITQQIGSGMLLWPGDPSPAFSLLSDGNVRVSQISFCTHSGTHIDAPVHMLKQRAYTDIYSIEQLCGIARVIEIPAVGEINAQVLSQYDIAGVERLLIKTGNSELLNKAGFCPDYSFLTEDAARYVLEKGIRLVAIDYLSLDEYNTDTYPAHRLLLESGIVIAEGVDLHSVPPNDYELLCLPLKISSDGAPVRMLLRTI